MPFEIHNTCTVLGCLSDFSVNISTYERRHCVDDRYLCEEHADQFIAQHCQNDDHGIVHNLQPKRATRFDIDMIACYRNRDQHSIFLRELNGARRFVYSAGMFEVVTLIRRLMHQESLRPMTHQAMAEVLEALDGKLQDVIVYDLVKRQTDSYYCAYLRIARAGDVINVDVRPSDALTLAVICETPILIDDTVLIAATSAD